jgi:UDP-N-acetylmuramoyl-tripeptide--D-alanyl-D-alanine ligase
MKFWTIQLLLLVGSSLFVAKRLLRHLHYMQLEEYMPRRFLSWSWQKKAFDRRGSYVAIFVSIALFLSDFSMLLTLLGTCVLGSIAFFEKDPRKNAKVALKITARAKRIYSVACILLAVLQLGFFAIFSENLPFLWASQIILFQSIPFSLVFACMLLEKNENLRQQNFMREAKRQLEEVNPFIIGVTGSYGKTSTKEALGKILQATRGPTFWPGKSINTLMGITREVRTHLKQGIQYAVIEMGAYGSGSIQRLCTLTPPQAAIITGIGLAHLERFGTEESIFLGKAELAKAVPPEGILVCNGDNPGARQIAKENPKKQLYLYGLNPHNTGLDATISTMEVTLSGTRFTLQWRGKTYPAFTPLLGKAALSNVLGAFTMACALGSDPEYVLGVIRNLEPVDNRLELQQEEGITYLKDAYNSNPYGFTSALEVLAALPVKRRILVTPGMIELGSQQEFQNHSIGKLAGQICDMAIIVGETNRKALETGILSGGIEAHRLICCSSREEAFALLKKLVQEEDGVLIENDLTDLYERPDTF